MKKIGEYQLDKELGSGAFGQVFRAYKERDPNVLYAIKIIPKVGLSMEDNKSLEREVEMLQMTDNENLVKLYDLVLSDNNYCLICEYCNGGDLFKFFKARGGKLEEPLIRSIIRQVVNGMDELYKKNAMHRDIKQSNILLHYPDNDHTKLVVKLADFGFARILGPKHVHEGLLGQSLFEFKEHMSIVGTPLNMAPELLSREAYSFKADIWSLGIVLYELCCGKACFGGDCNDFFKRVEMGIYKIPSDKNLSAECLDLINGCLQQNSHTRINWNDILEHPFICSEAYTNFDVDRFTQLNSGRRIIEGTEFAFSSKIRSTFFATRVLIEADRGECVIIDLANNWIADYYDYVRVEVPTEESSASSEHISRKIDELKLEENHFK